jgi:hypothetical protein
MGVGWPRTFKKRSHYVGGDVFNALRVPARAVVFVNGQSTDTLYRFAGGSAAV